jgi:hypothetical protein
MKTNYFEKQLIVYKSEIVLNEERLKKYIETEVEANDEEDDEIGEEYSDDERVVKSSDQ